MKNLIEGKIVEHYLNSNDFNGIQIGELLNAINKEWVEVKAPIYNLVKEGSIGIIDEETDINPNIIRTHFEAIDSQLKKAQREDPGYMCLYPTRSTLKKNINPDDYRNEPYKLRLALGEAQLSYVPFDLSVLEYYRNDPRYRYKNDDIRGSICYDDEQMAEGDKTFLKEFGFAYDENLNRSIAVFLRYLADLSPEHQQIWKAKELTKDYILHPDYYRNTIIGDFGEKEPICHAILKELYIINKMSEAIARPHLFKNDYGKYGEEKPKKFHLLIRPTLEEFNDFVLLLDKMLSENVNVDFFSGEVSREEEKLRNDGKIEVTLKNSLRMLDEWMRKYFKPHDWSEWEEAVATLKRVRKLRQEPAHVIKQNIFDQKYFKEQIELIKSSYKAVRLIRLILANHPKVKSAEVDIPSWLQNGKIWTI